MPKGGARNKSGPARDLDSGRTERLKIALTDLPSGGFDGPAPEFPLPMIYRMTTYVDEDGQKVTEIDGRASSGFRDREVSIWHGLWRLPQAVAWEREPWRHETLAEMFRLKTAIEIEPDKSAALVGQLHRYRDQVGLTDAGMRFNGWAIKHDEMSKRRSGPVAVADDEDDPRDRLAADDAAEA